MRDIFRLIALTLAASILTGCIYLPEAQNEYTKEWSLHTCGKNDTGVVVAAEPMAHYSPTGGNKAWCYPVRETRAALEFAVKQGGADKPLILFVHGRGAHPGKGLDKNLIHYLTYENRANVVMFHWPSYKGIFGYAEKSAKEAQDELETFLKKARSFKNSTGALQPPRTILLVHSMGNIVLKTLAANSSRELQGKPFDTLILNAPDVSYENSKPWLDNIDVAKQQLLHVSYKDKILFSSRWFFKHGEHRLGRCVKAPYSDNFIYVDFNGTGVDHLYYIDQGPKKFPFKGGKWKGNEAVKTYFQTALAGETVVPGNISGMHIGSAVGPKLWRFTARPYRKSGIEC